ncbi:MAG: Hpt domain-containing protein [Bacteroidetes bacterium]|nr:MAG: Hpt domain-containing protein [Bacteroidota bacterium]
MNNASYKNINLEYLEVMSDGDVETKKTMLEMLLSDLPNDLREMRQLLDEKNWGDLSRASHKMKSTLSFVGNTPMIEANKELEQLAKQADNPDQIESLMRILEDTLDPVLSELREELEAL